VALTLAAAIVGIGNAVGSKKTVKVRGLRDYGFALFAVRLRSMGVIS
jgi:hypothetical protein